MGKGSAPRPMEIDREQFGNRFDAIFGKPKEAVKEQVQPMICPACGMNRSIGHCGQPFNCGVLPR